MTDNVDCISVQYCNVLNDVFFERRGNCIQSTIYLSDQDLVLPCMGHAVQNNQSSKSTAWKLLKNNKLIKNEFSYMY